MICLKCGHQLPENATACPQCGAPVMPADRQEAANSYKNTSNQPGAAPSGPVNIPPGDPRGYSGQPTPPGGWPAPYNGRGVPPGQQPMGFNGQPMPYNGQTIPPANQPGVVDPRRGFAPPPQKKTGSAKKVIVLVAASVSLCVILAVCGFFGYNVYKDKQCQSRIDAADQALAAGDLDAALNLYLSALTIRPGKTEAVLGAGDVYLRQEKYDSAESILRQLNLSEEDPLRGRWKQLLEISVLNPRLTDVDVGEFPKIRVTVTYTGEQKLEKGDFTLEEDSRERRLEQYAQASEEATLTYITEETDISEEYRQLGVTLKVGDYSFRLSGDYYTPEIRDAYVTLVSTDISEYPKIKVYLRIEDLMGGEAVDGLSTGSITIRERLQGGEYLSREVHTVAPLEGNAGLNTSLVADKSDSISDSDMEKIKKVMTEFVRNLHFEDGDKAEVLAFDSIVQQMCTFTSDSTLLINGISNMSTDGRTAFYDAVYNGVNHAALQGGARCVIAFTDGIDNESYKDPYTLVQYANECQVPIYIIGVGYYVEEYTPRSIAESTNGRYWFIDDLYDLQEIFDEIYAEQKDLYTVEYITDASADQYASRTIEINVCGGGYRAVSEAEFVPVHTVPQQVHTSRYELFKEALSWEEANQRCHEKGGHLATITSQAEMDQLVKMCKDAGVNYVWLGGYTSYDSAGKVFGHWVTGEEFSYSAWSKGEPSRVDQDGTPEWYIMLWNVERLGGWSWNDQRNDPAKAVTYMAKSMGYICEYEN